MMERRAFIKQANAAIVSGLLLSPARLTSQPWSSQLDRLVTLPHSQEHVRHGLFQLREVSHPFLPAWLQLYERHRFFANGFERSDKDLELFSFRIMDRIVTVGFGEGRTYLISDQEVTELDRDEKVMAGTYLLRSATTLALGPGRERFILALKGPIEVNNEPFEEGEFMVSDQGLSIRQDRDCLALIVAQPSS